MKRVWTLVIGLVGMGVPLTATACEPIVPLAKLLGSSTAFGAAFYIQSAVWLFVAIVLKCAAFVFFERRLSWYQAAGFMLLANIVSTIPGLFIAALTSAGPAVIFVLPIIYCLGLMVERRTRDLPGVAGRRWMKGGVATLAFILFFVLAVILYGLADVALDRHGEAGYWMVKFLFVTLVACTGLVISAILEECVVARCCRKTAGAMSFYTSVVRANYVTLGAILLVGAIAILPERLRSPGFLVSWLNALWASAGLG